MTHLRIELNNIQENVSSAVIEKLYELATSGDLDLSSNLAGNLHTTATYLEYIDGITGEFPELTISSDNIYIMFADPEVKRVMATLFGNGTNVSASDLIGVTEIPQYLFKDNLSIRTFDELNNLRGITTLGREAFRNCTNLTSINTGNITSIGERCFSGCTNLTSLDTSNVTTIGIKPLNGSGISRAVLPKVTTLPNEAFANSSNFTYIEFGEDLTYIGTLAFWDSSNLSTLVFRSTVPPTMSTTNSNKFLHSMSNLTIYVPDASLTDYLTAWSAMANNITGISNLPQS